MTTVFTTAASEGLSFQYGILGICLGVPPFHAALYCFCIGGFRVE